MKWLKRLIAWLKALFKKQKMRKNVTLFIGDIQADLDNDALILFNYTQEDLQNPTIVKNSYSQQVTLKGTDVNNRIFGTYFRNDRLTGSGFNALQQVPFTIYNEMSEVLESGYCKLESVGKKGADISYKVSLYGGLGGFLYGLMYDNDGNKKTLADLIYTENGDADEFNFRINRDAVRDAWRYIAGIDTTTSDKWAHINFAPCYNGLPAGSFASNKAFCPTTCFGVQDSVTEGGVNYKAKYGHVLVTLANKYDEWAVGDLRSYLQRPVLKVKSIIDAIADSSQNGGYTVELDNTFFKSANPYYYDSWMTLPRLDALKVPVDNGTENISWGVSASLALQNLAKTLTNGDKGAGSTYTIKAEFKPQAKIPEGVGLGTWSMAKGYNQTLDESFRNVIFYQLVAYDKDNNKVGGSKVACVSSEMVNPNHFPTTITTLKALQLCTQGVSIYPAPYTPLWNPTNNLADIAGTMYIGDMEFPMNPFSSLATFTGNSVKLEVEAANVHHVVLQMCPVGIKDDDATYTAMGGAIATLFNKTADNNLEVAGYQFTQYGYTNNAAYQVNAQVRSDAYITKKILLGGTASPADYLLSYCKMFGLYMLYDNANKKISIVTRNILYKPNSGNIRTYDLDERIDRKNMNIVPYVLDSRWYDFGNKVDSAAWADYYLATKGIRYGLKRVNTGFSFNANHKEVLEGNSFKGACEVLEQNKYFVRITQDSKPCPSPFLDGGKFSLWDANLNVKELDIQIPSADLATLTYMNTTYKGYDCPTFPKVQFHDSDNKAMDGSNVLLLFVGAENSLDYGRFCLSDDNYLMSFYNEGTPCWLLGQYQTDTDYKISNSLRYPIFRRYNSSNVTKSLDMGTPLEVNEPTINIPNPDTSSIYSQGWKLYITDRYDVDTRIMTCKVNLRGLGEQIGQNLMRNFYYFDSSWWVLNKIKNYSITTEDLVECEFIKVKDTTNYSAGQTY